MSDPSQTDLTPDAAGAEGSARPAPGSGGAAAVAAQAPAPTIETAAQLAAAREARGWSVADLASKLGMGAKQIEAIERGDWGALPGQAFVRGALRAYGKALQADVEPLISSIAGAVRAAELRPSASLDAPLPRHGALGFDNGGSGSRLTWILLGILGVIAIAMYFGRGAEWSRVLEGGPTGAGAPGRAIESVPLKPPALPGAPGAPGAAPSAPSAPNPPSSSNEPLPSTAPASTGGPASTAAPASTGAANAPSPTSAPAAQSSPDGAASASAPSTPADAGASAAGVPLRLRFERESWVEVRDASGKLLLHGTQPAGSARDIAGRKPYSLVIGNAAHVRLEHDGREIDLGAIARQGVARLKID
jgi:cytoskeleton protein RodZ